MYHATNDDLHLWFFGGDPPPKPKVDIEKTLQAAAMLHWPLWSLSELEKQKLREEKRISERGIGKASFDRENGKSRKYIRKKKIVQMRDWILSLAKLPSDVKKNFTSFEVVFCRSFYYKFYRYGEKTRWVTEKQYETLAVIAARHLAPNALSIPAGNLGISKTESSNPASVDTPSMSMHFEGSLPEKGLDCSANRDLQKLLKEGWEIVKKER